MYNQYEKFALLVLIIFLQILLWAFSMLNRKRLIKDGAIETAKWQSNFFLVFRIFWIAGLFVEVFVEGQTTNTMLMFVGTFLFMVAATLKLSTMLALRNLWTLDVLTLTDLPVVTGGIYRYIRHPFYLALLLEAIAVPLLFGAVKTAIIFGVLYIFLVRTRVIDEERLLTLSNRYMQSFSKIPRYYFKKVKK